MHDQDVKFSYATLCEERKNKHTMLNFSFSFQAWMRSPRVQLQWNTIIIAIFSKLE